jgi:hypothetical protein
MASRTPAPLIACAALALGIAACGGDDTGSGERDRAIAAARDAYDRAVAEGVDLDAGPCIAEDLVGVPGWVADIAHDPREEVDDDPANQCASHREGNASHFVELTPDGEVIRAE